MIGMKVVLDENGFGMKVVLDESGFGMKVFWIKIFGMKSATFIPIWMKVYLTDGESPATQTHASAGDQHERAAVGGHSIAQQVKSDLRSTHSLEDLVF